MVYSVKTFYLNSARATAVAVALGAVVLAGTTAHAQVRHVSAPTPAPARAQAPQGGLTVVRSHTPASASASGQAPQGGVTITHQTNTFDGKHLVTNTQTTRSDVKPTSPTQLVQAAQTKKDQAQAALDAAKAKQAAIGPDKCVGGSFLCTQNKQHIEKRDADKAVKAAQANYDKSVQQLDKYEGKNEHTPVVRGTVTTTSRNPAQIGGRQTKTVAANPVSQAQAVQSAQTKVDQAKAKLDAAQAKLNAIGPVNCNTGVFCTAGLKKQNADKDLKAAQQSYDASVNQLHRLQDDGQDNDKKTPAKVM